MTMEELKGHVVLVYFWDYTNLGCLNALPYIRAWREKYRRLGLRMVGVHTPEFPFGRSAVAVRNAVNNLGIKNSILLDGEYEVWNSYGNRTWPGFFVINAEGTIVYSDVGECAYGNIESVIQDLLRKGRKKKVLPELTPAAQPMDEPGLPLLDVTPTLRTGYEGESIGNEEGFEPHRVVSYEIPPKKMVEGQFYLNGKWLNHRFSVAVAKAHDGPEASIEIPYTAKIVNVVIHPQGDIGFSVNLELNGQPLTKTTCGDDVRLAGRGAGKTSVLIVSEARMYQLVRHEKLQSGVLRMSSRSGGLAIYSFSFSSTTEKDGEKPIPMVKALIGNRAKAKKSIVLTAKALEKELAKTEKEEKKKARAEKAAAKKLAAKKEAEEKATPKKAAAKKGTAKKAAPKKAAAKKETAKKAAPKKAAAKKETAKKAAPKKTTAKKAAPKKATAKKETAKKATTKKAAASKKKGIKAENADDAAREVLRTRAGKKPVKKAKKKK